MEQALKQAREQVAAVDAMSEEETSRRISRARSRAQRERQQRLEQALEEFEKLAEPGSGKDKENRRVSTSDPEARVMKQARRRFCAELQRANQHGCEKFRDRSGRG